MRHEVGNIGLHPVIYEDEADVVFCKNTTLKFNLINRILRDQQLRERVEDKELTITQEGELVTLGCLKTTRSNLLDIRRQILKVRNIDFI